MLLAKPKLRSKELAARIGLSEQNLSQIKAGKVRGIRFSTLVKFCDALDCQPGDLLTFVREESGVCPPG